MVADILSNITEASARIIRALKIALFLVSLIGASIFALWMEGRFLEARNAGKDCQSQGRFDQIKAMLLAYYEKNGTFPPTKYQLIPDGPEHSWRVLLLPYTDEYYQKQYEQYDFSQEWDSPNNLKAVGGMPCFDYFSSMDAEDKDITIYLAIGDNDIWPSHKPLKSYLITKGKDRFLVVEYPDSKIHWMEPKY